MSRLGNQLLVALALLFLAGSLRPQLVTAALTFTGDARRDFANIDGAFFEMADVVDDTRCSPALTDPCLLLSSGRKSGWDIKTVFLAWSYADDLLYVGIDCSGICGDVDGDGFPGSPTNIDKASLGGCESVAVMIDVVSNQNGTFKPSLALGLPGALHLRIIYIFHF